MNYDARLKDGVATDGSTDVDGKQAMNKIW
jgi:hypothetical protein